MIEVRNLRHEYVRATKHIDVLAMRSFVVQKGSLILVLGASGAGKTTLLHILAGLLPPTAGTVLVGDVDMYALSEPARDRHRAGYIGYLMQDPPWLDSLSAEENVMLPMLFAGAPPAAMRQRARDLLARFGLEQRLDQEPRALSTGERIRVAFARALSADPPVLLADEPTASLDADNARRIAALLTSLAKDQGKAIVVATHDRALFDRADGDVVLSPLGATP